MEEMYLEYKRLLRSNNKNLFHGQSRAFFPSILQCSHNRDHPQDELAKFGYRSETKIERFKNPAIFWQPAGTYCPNVAISSLKSGNIGTFFIHKNALYELLSLQKKNCSTMLIFYL
jgi:hypothetical protein